LALIRNIKDFRHTTGPILEWFEKILDETLTAHPEVREALYRLFPGEDLEIKMIAKHFPSAPTELKVLIEAAEATVNQGNIQLLSDRLVKLPQLEPHLTAIIPALQKKAQQ